MKKEFLKSAVTGFLLGCFACLLFSVALSLRMGTGNFYFVLPALADIYHKELTAALIQMTAFCWFGTACGIAYRFSENRELPPAKQGAGYLVSLTVGLVPAAVTGQWFKHIFIGIFSYCIIIAVASLLIFAVGLVKLNRDVEKIRQAIGIKELPAVIPTELSEAVAKEKSAANPTDKSTAVPKDKPAAVPKDKPAAVPKD